eukprot:14524087-Alexandrium_andersonii.AAC.1
MSPEASPSSANAESSARARVLERTRLSRLLHPNARTRSKTRSYRTTSSGRYSKTRTPSTDRTELRIEPI